MRPMEKSRADAGWHGLTRKGSPCGTRRHGWRVARSEPKGQAVAKANVLSHFLTFSLSHSLPRIIILAAFALIAAPRANAVLLPVPIRQPAGDIDPEHELDRAVADVVDLIDSGGSWDTCRRRLDAAIIEYGQPEFDQDARRLLAGIEAACNREERTMGPHPDALSDAMAGLTESQIDAGLIFRPFGIAGRYGWQDAVPGKPVEGMDPAYRLFAAGRQAIPTVLDGLDDLATTRTIFTRDDVEPVVFRVCDVCLSLIEGITHCRFGAVRSQPPLISQWPQADRAELIAGIREWWQHTKDLTPTEAVVRRIEAADRLQQAQMIDVLIASGEKTAALRCLEPLYLIKDDIDLQMSVRMVQAGSREPLAHVHEVAAAGRPLTVSMVRLIATIGDRQDYELLYRLVTGLVAEGRAGDDQVVTLTRVLAPTDNSLAIPILVAIIKPQVPQPAVELADWPIPAYVDVAATAVQRLAGVSFGYRSDDPRRTRWQALTELVEWWRTEGFALYGFERNRPHGTSGVR